jgi:hypothetical protein
LTGCAASESENGSGVSRGTVSNPRIVYRPHPDSTPETELSALAAVYKFVLDCRAQKKGGPATAPDSAKKGSDEFSARVRIP